MLEREIQVDCPRCRGTGQVTLKSRVSRHSLLAMTLAAPCSCAAGRTIAAPAMMVRA